jgi:hypothetical protein
VAEDGAFAGEEQRRPVPAFAREPPVPDRVDALVDRVEPTGADPVSDLVARQAVGAAALRRCALGYGFAT